MPRDFRPLTTVFQVVGEVSYYLENGTLFNNGWTDKEVWTDREDAAARSKFLFNQFKKQAGDRVVFIKLEIEERTVNNRMALIPGILENIIPGE